MRFSKNNIQNILLLISAGALILSMLSMLGDSSFLKYETPIVLLLAIVLVIITSTIYAILVIRRINPKKYIYFSYSSMDKQLADKIILTLDRQFMKFSKYRFEILTADSVPFGNSIYATTKENLLKADVIIIIVSPSYLESTWCKEEFITIADMGKRIIPIVTESFADLSKLPVNLADIKALSLGNYSSEEDFLENIALLAKDLIRQRRD